MAQNGARTGAGSKHATMHGLRTSPAMKLSLVLALCVALPATVLAQAPSGLGVAHTFGGWVVACDNTRVCEAQGYHADGAALPAVLTVQRAPGPGVAARWSIGFGFIDGAHGGEAPQPSKPVTLRAGAWRMTLPAPTSGNATIVLTAAQAQALQPALLRAGELRLASSGREWVITLAGSTAALLKMDDLQGRVGTPGALVRPGTRPETSVPAAPAVPTVTALRLPAPRPADAALLPAMRRALQSEADTCPSLTEDDKGNPGQIFRLSDSQVLVVFDCWRAAYNSGRAAWMAHDRPPFAPVIARFQAPGDETPGEAADLPAIESFTRASDGSLTAFGSAKGRGIGDCFTARDWVWDGQRFALTEATESACRLFSAGGVPIRLWRAQVR